jgi:hypothetical protein
VLFKEHSLFLGIAKVGEKFILQNLVLFFFEDLLFFFSNFLKPLPALNFNVPREYKTSFEFK